MVHSSTHYAQLKQGEVQMEEIFYAQLFHILGADAKARKISHKISNVRLSFCVVVIFTMFFENILAKRRRG